MKKTHIRPTKALSFNPVRNVPWNPPGRLGFVQGEEKVPYSQAWAWQKGIVEEKIALIEKSDHCPDSQFILQHRRVYTLTTASSEDLDCLPS
ncbi:hypothetical protein DVH24_009631 [Malus domestica]|uniref:Uncharacterized protein n=1 Tax=Malus domestica TaxID=3750 RepID=A0A498JLH3_MALDO|nr:hypothetical protein DVH24_009631 [Malus domestica]